MCALNMVLFGLHALVRQGDALKPAPAYVREWHTLEGLVMEPEPRPEIAVAPP